MRVMNPGGECMTNGGKCEECGVERRWEIKKKYEQIGVTQTEYAGSVSRR
jgi:hypothetical protein